jgi:GDPmannose 4,6-dehydratase
MKRRALITGITGQDGYYLTKLLLEKDYEIFGMIRRHNRTGTELGTVSSLESLINFDYGDMTDASSLEAIVHRIKPHEVYNLAAQSHVKISFDSPVYTANTNALGVVHLLEAVTRTVPSARFYQASTSEMFGNSVDTDGFQRESTCMKPVSPYGVAKLYAHQMVNVYRIQHNLFACSGILFNHESPMRGDLFVTKKITNYIKDVRKNGFFNKLQLGNLDARRDWGHAEDYVHGMWLMLQHQHPDDYVLSTGLTYSIREFLQKAFDYIGISDYTAHVEIDQRFLRPEDVHHLKGDSTKVRTVLKWSPKHNLDTLIQSMIEG